MRELIGKVFFYEEADWEVVEILTGDYMCIARSYSTDEERRFACAFAERWISKYNADIAEYRKEQDAYIFKEDNEKAMIEKVFNAFCKNTYLGDLTLDELRAVGNIRKILNHK